MLAIHPNEKSVTTDDIICLSDLALRWSHSAIFKILLHLGTRRLPVYVWRNDATGPDGRKFHLIYETNRHSDFDWLIAKMPLIFFLCTDVEELEGKHPEYRTTSPLREDEKPLLLASTDNLSQLIPLILHAWGQVKGNSDKVINGLLNMRHDGSDPFIESILEGNGVTIESDKIRPTFIQDFEKRRPFTKFELAQEFVKLCKISNKKKHDRYLAILEVDKRFPGLTPEDIATLFPGQEKIEQESRDKRGKRLRKEAYKFEKLSFDYPVP